MLVPRKTEEPQGKVTVTKVPVQHQPYFPDGKVEAKIDS